MRSEGGACIGLKGKGIANCKHMSFPKSGKGCRRGSVQRAFVLDFGLSGAKHRKKPHPCSPAVGARDGNQPGISSTCVLVSRMGLCERGRRTGHMHTPLSPLHQILSRLGEFQVSGASRFFSGLRGHGGVLSEQNLPTWEFGEIFFNLTRIG
jgi:hypothetical protein